jgi:hypothetical protein
MASGPRRTKGTYFNKFLVAIFFFCILFGLQQLICGVQSAVNARLTGNAQIIPIPNLSQQINGVRGKSLVYFYPPGIVGNSGIQVKFKVLSFSRLQCSLANSHVGTVFQLQFRIIESSAEHVDVAADNMRWSASNINDLKDHGTPNGLNKYSIARIVAEFYDSCVTNNEFRSELQNDRGVPEFRSLLHLAKLAFHEVRLTPDRVEAAAHNYALMHHLCGLLFQKGESADAHCDATNPYKRQEDVDPKRSDVITVFIGGFDDPYIGVNVFLGFGLWGCGFGLLYLRRSDWRGWILVLLSAACWGRLAASIQGDQEYRQTRQATEIHHNTKIVSHKYLDSM